MNVRVAVVPAGHERDELDGELRQPRLPQEDDVDESVIDRRLGGEREPAP